MHEQNLDIYGHAPIPWLRALKQLEAVAREEGPGRTRWLATTDPDGPPPGAADHPDQWWPASASAPALPREPPLRVASRHVTTESARVRRCPDSARAFLIPSRA